MLEVDEENRLLLELENLKKPISDNEQIITQENDQEKISAIFQEASKLNDLLKKRNDELIWRSVISSDIIDQVKSIENENTDALNYIENDIVENEMKRRHIEDNQFDAEFEGFISSGTLDLLSSLYNKESDIRERYPFLFNIASVINNYLLQSKKKYFGDFQIGMNEES